MQSLRFTGMLVLGLLMVMLAVTGCKKKEINGGSMEPASAGHENAVEEAAQDAAEEEESKAGGPAAAVDAESEVEEEAGTQEGGDEGSIPEDKANLVLKLPKATMPGVKFAHLKHSDEYQVACRTCHHNEGESRDCMSCHGAKKGPEGELSFKDAAHKSCMGCHKTQKKGPTVCNKCHK
jgi:hypothetical protein